jgi:indolepyruvate ferredoxin oxidoreductase
VSPTSPEVSLEDRYLLDEGRVFLTGVQALVRLPMVQARRDRAAGLRVGTYVTGYPGSPLGGYDLAMQQAGRVADAHGVVHAPAQNEEGAIGALLGTQMLERYPHSRYDGVVGLWYGKGPGLDRSGDALRHGTYAGTSRHGAVVILSGEDHEAKSSTIPYQQEWAFVHAGIPVLYPASIAETLELGLHAIALSRYSGVWAAMKLVGPLCDGGETIAVEPDAPRIVVPELEIDGAPFAKEQYFRFFPGETVETERRLYDERLVAARAYGEANALDRVVTGGPDDRIGIVTAGKNLTDTRRALADLGLDDGALRRAGIRLIQIRMLYPLSETFLRAATAGLRELIVVEDKRGFLEERVKEALYAVADRPVVVGKRDEAGATLFPAHGGLDADAVAERLGARLRAHVGDAAGGIDRRLDQLAAVAARGQGALPIRVPNYCSGCPHNISTVVAEGQSAWGAPGCHAFANAIGQPERSIDGYTQYGGEGLPWIGLAPFSDRRHIIQNIGDGALFHSSYMNVRACVAAGVDITFRVLFNGSIANTGGQPAVGGTDAANLARLLALEGVKRVAIIAAEPSDYAPAQLPDVVTVHGAADLQDVQAKLAETPGVTVLLYDGMCANERRRQRKRGLLPPATEFVLINEDVCENCGHCGELTNCMSLHKVPTEFGPKTQVHQSTCNQDTSCLGGDCPSFITVQVTAGTGLRKVPPPAIAADAVPAPEPPELVEPFHVYLPGVGGTGVLTVNALLAWAALIDGKHAVTYDQTGGAQKWGAVISSIILSRPDAEAVPTGNHIGTGRADLYLCLDPMSGADPANVRRCSRERTAAVINSGLLPNGEMVRDISYAAPVDAMVRAVGRHTHPDRTLVVPARDVAEQLLGDHMATNVVAVGVALQAGLLPLAAESIEAAIRLNGVAVDANLQAFRYGRLLQHDPAGVAELVAARTAALRPRGGRAVERLGARQSRHHRELLSRCEALGEESRRLLGIRIAELIEYQDAGYAERYVDFVLDVAARERAAVGAGAGLDVTQEVARQLYKLMAYKDEYEVARLHLTAGLKERAAELFAEPRTVKYNLHPPVLRALGMKRKLRFGPSFNIALRALRGMRRLRGTALDPFGYAAIRRRERWLVGWYQDLVRTGLDALRPDNVAAVVALAGIPDGIRGYEDIKARRIEAAVERAGTLVQDLAAAPAINIVQVRGG